MDKYAEVHEPSLSLILLAATSDLKAIRRFKQRLGHLLPEEVFTKATEQVARRIHVEIDQAISQLVNKVD